MTAAVSTSVLGVNGRRLSATNDQAYVLITAIADGALDTVADMVAVLQPLVEPTDR